MAELDTVTIPELDNLTLALSSYFATSNLNGKLGKATVADFVNFIKPFLQGLSASGFAPVIGTVLPVSPVNSYSIVGAGTYTQTTGGSITTTALLSIIVTNGTTWSLVKGIDTTAFVNRSEFNSGMNNMLGYASFLTKNDITAITIPAIDSDVAFFNLFDVTRAVIYNRVKLATNIAGNVVLVKSNADYSVLTDLLTIAVPGGIFDYTFAGISLAIGERLGIKSLGTCKLLYINTSGIGFHSTKGTGANVLNSEIAYQLFGPLTTYKTLSELNVNVETLTAKQIVDNASIATNSAAITDALGSFQTLTKNDLSLLTTAATTAETFTNNFDASTIRRYNKAKIKTSAAGSVVLVKSSLVSGVMTFTDVVTLSVNTGVTDVSFDLITLAVGERLGVKTGGTVRLLYINTSGVGFYATNGVVTANSEVSYQLFGPAVSYKTLTTLTSDVNSILSAAAVLDKNTLFSDDFSTDTWTKTGWTYSVGKYTSSALGVANRLELPKSYWLDKRAAMFTVRFSANSDLRIHMMYGNSSTVPATLAMGVGASMFGINAATMKITLYRADVANSQFTPIGVTNTPEVETLIPFPIVAGRDYAVCIKKDNVTHSLILMDKTTGASVTSQIVGEAAGRQNEKYGFFVNSGGAVDITGFKVSKTITDVEIVGVGDSIMEGKGATVQENRYMEKIRSVVPKTIICARGGATVSDMITMLNTEVLLLKPKKLIFCGGANGGLTSAQITAVITFCTANNIKLYLNHVSSLRTTDQHISINALIDTFSLPGMKSDYATAIDNFPFVDGTHPSPRANRTLYDADDLVHPNNLGYIEMAKRIALDIPEVVDYKI